MLVLVWCFCLAGAALPLLGFGGYAYSEARFLCGPSFAPDHRAFVLLWTLLGVAVPTVTMCSLYGCIVYVARKQARRGTFMCNELHCFHVPANNYLRSSIVVVATSGESSPSDPRYAPAVGTATTPIKHLHACYHNNKG